MFLWMRDFDEVLVPVLFHYLFDILPLVFGGYAVNHISQVNVLRYCSSFRVYIISLCIRFFFPCH